MADVHDRFLHHLPMLFERHGINLVGKWSAIAGGDAPRFVYLTAYSDYARREAVWGDFYRDDEWWRIRAETNAGHEMVLQHDLLFLKPNPSWDAGLTSVDTVGGLHEMVQHEVAPGRGAEANTFLRDSYLPLLRDAGAQVLGVFDMAAGVGMQKIVLLCAWPDAGLWLTGRRRIESDASLRAALAMQRQAGGTGVFRRSEITPLDPAPGAVIRADLGRATE